jgi:hypothetical protein
MGTTTASIGYTGIVTLSQYIGGKKFIVAKTHNAGGKPLFNFLADCLVGDFEIARIDRPTKILLLNIDDNQQKSVATDTRFIYMLSKPERVYSDSEGIVRYSFIVPQDIFAGTKFNAIGLYTDTATTQDVNDYAAFCTLAPDFFNNVSVSSVLVLDWELHISNV